MPTDRGEAAAGRRDERDLTTVYGSVAFLGSRTEFMNLGLWERAEDLDSAAEALVRRVAREAGIGPEDELLDVGFGRGDQLLLVADEFTPARLVGLDAFPAHVALARAKLEAEGLADRVEAVAGSATRIPFEAETFTRVTAVESALHFSPRTDFFHHAYRVLKGGGRLVTADILTRRRHPLDVAARLSDVAAAATWRIPSANLVDKTAYARQLEAAGFENVRVESIAEHVFKPFSSYLSHRLATPGAERELGKMGYLRWMWAIATGPYLAANYDYVIAVADKPKLEFA